MSNAPRDDDPVLPEPGAEPIGDDDPDDGIDNEDPDSPSA